MNGVAAQREGLAMSALRVIEPSAITWTYRSAGLVEVVAAGGRDVRDVSGRHRHRDAEHAAVVGAADAAETD